MSTGGSTGHCDHSRYADSSESAEQDAVIGEYAGCIEGDAGLFTRADQASVPTAIVGSGRMVGNAGIMDSTNNIVSK